MDFGSAGTSDYYPTDGVGGSGTGSLSSASHLRNAIKWELTGFTILAIGAADRTWTLKDQAGTTIATWTVPTTKIVGDEIPAGFQFNISQGFTISTDNTDCHGRLSYKIIRYDPSV